MKILLVEDNAQNRYLATFLLERQGHEVVSAESGPAGLALAGTELPDLIVLDIQLPGMDGHAVARALKADPALAHIPIVAVTSYAMAGDRETVLQAGAQGYIEKPIDPDTFAAEIAQYFPTRAQGPKA